MRLVGDGRVGWSSAAGWACLCGKAGAFDGCAAFGSVYKVFNVLDCVLHHT